jgi:hypothetical protein
MSEETPVFETPFKEETIKALTVHITAAIGEFSKEHPDVAVDYFVALAALSQTAFEMSYHTWLKTQEDRDLGIKEVSIVVDGLLAKMNGIRAEHHVRTSSDIIAATQLVGLLADRYCRIRDESVMQILQQNMQQAGPQDGEQPAATDAGEK